jgi:hypothetical protein
MYAISRLTIPASVSSARPGYASAACHGFRVPVPYPHIGRRSWRHVLRESFCTGCMSRDTLRRGLRNRSMDMLANNITTVIIVRKNSTAKPYRSSHPAATGTKNNAIKTATACKVDLRLSTFFLSDSFFIQLVFDNL